MPLGKNWIGKDWSLLCVCVCVLPLRTLSFAETPPTPSLHFESSLEPLSESPGAGAGRQTETVSETRRQTAIQIFEKSIFTTFS